jgi:uncharacterized cupredoxin-like copper-binding protein
MFNVALLIIGLTWIGPMESRQDRAEQAVNAPAELAVVAASPVAATAPSPEAPSVGGKLTATLNQWSIVPQATSVNKGPVTFTVTNAGTITHEFVVIRTDTPASDFVIASYEGEQDRVNEDTVGKNVGETGDMKVGQTKALTIDLKPGHYVFMCNLPGHYGLGMHTDFTVI